MVLSSCKGEWDSHVRNNLSGKLLIKTHCRGPGPANTSKRKWQWLLKERREVMTESCMLRHHCPLAAKHSALSGTGSLTYHDGNPRKYDGRDKLPDPAWKETQIRGPEIFKPLPFHLPKCCGPYLFQSKTPTQDEREEGRWLVIFSLCLSGRDGGYSFYCPQVREALMK